MPSRKRQCPRQARLHRHCLDSLEIPFSHPCVFLSPPICQVPQHFCQVSPPACQTQSRSCQVAPFASQIRPLDCPDTDIFSQVPPTACRVESPLCQVEHPRPPACAAFKSCLGSTPPYRGRYPVSQIKPTCQIPPLSCLLQPKGYQVDEPACQLQSPACQFLPPNCRNQIPSTMKQPICQWDQDFCTADTCHDSKKCRTGSQPPTPFCESSTDEDDIIMYSGCLGPCTQPEGGCENVEENDFDNPNSLHRSSNNQQDKSHENDENTEIHTTVSNTPQTTNQNANKTANYRNGRENTAKTQNISQRECVKSCQNQCFSDAAGSAIQERISNSDNLNNNSTGTNFHSTGSFLDSQGYHVRHKIPNDMNGSQTPQSTQDIDNIPVSKGNFSQISDNADSSSLWQTIPCCSPGYFQEKILRPNSLDNENFFRTRQEFNEVQSGSKTDNKICQHCCDTSDVEMSAYPTKPYTDENFKQSSTNTNIPDENFKQSSSHDAKEDIAPRIAPSSCPRSAFKNLSNMCSTSGANVPTQEHSYGTCVDCSICTNKVNNPHTTNSAEYRIDSVFQSEHAKSQTRFANQNGQSEFDNSISSKGRKHFANCCKRGISKVLEPPELASNVSTAECGKKEACIQEVGASSCASASCVANNTDSVCGCRYPPAFKQFSCAGNINGTCNCSEKS